MSLYRYKATFSADPTNAPYKYGVLRFWFYITLFQIFVSGGESVGLFYSSITFLLLELLVIYLATEHDFFRKIMTKMLFSISLLFATLYSADFLLTNDILGNSLPFISEHNDLFLTISIWHFIAYIIAITTNYFNCKKLRKPFPKVDN
jgi:hypothetical protein